MDNPYVIILTFLGLVITAIGVAAYFFSRSFTKQIEEALKNATEEEQKELRNKIVKAVFPPRFPRH